MDKLGTTTQDATTVMVDIAALDAGGGVVNGPKDLLDWEAIAWRDQEAQVQRLRQRIFKGCLSRVPRRVASTVLRGARRSNAPRLPDQLHWLRDVI
ncbi:MAG: hypothetical protein LC808_22040 [Actinobacteria bacterium]|nr:hypothetical protein [Actinomycetota bacterium]